LITTSRLTDPAVLSDFSSPAVSDGNLPLMNDHRHPSARRDFKEILFFLWMLHQIDKDKSLSFIPVGLTGPSGKGSGFFAVNRNHEFFCL
jgi:hypothetical protein